MAGDGTMDAVVTNEPTSLRRDAKDKKHILGRLVRLRTPKPGYCSLARLQKREDNNGGASGFSGRLLGSTCTKTRISQERLSVSNSGIYRQVAFAQYYAQSQSRKSRWRNETDMSHRVAPPCVSSSRVGSQKFERFGAWLGEICAKHERREEDNGVPVNNGRARRYETQGSNRVSCEECEEKGTGGIRAPNPKIFQNSSYKAFLQSSAPLAIQDGRCAHASMRN
ncbi:hypothetical protein EDC04DRAFT_3099215 [Pisolithus marmoratus]|nr:hypothetical protein EDC04DRAFT_3099215 [Pisolithus marmoratus]